jgi:membrane-bound serine protease (ClpP class)
VILPILLVVASLCVLVLEVFLVSFGTLALVAITLGATGVVLAFGHSALFGWTLVGVLFVGAPGVLWGTFRLLPRLGFARGLYLRKPDLTDADRRAGARPMSHLLGAIGEARTPLRPSGTAVFGGDPVQVVTRGTMVSPGTRVKVVDVTGNRVVVEELDGAP